MKEIAKKIRCLSFFVLALTLASCNSDDYTGREVYGMGFDVSSAERSEFLVGEKVQPSTFTFIGYEGGDEIEIDPSEITVSPSGALTSEDTTLTFQWKTYTISYDIKVSKSLISKCEAENGLFKYQEIEHTLNKQGEEPDATSSDSNVNCVDDRYAEGAGKTYSDGTVQRFLENVAYGSDFTCNLNLGTEGYIYLYASVASNVYMWGSAFEEKYDGLQVVGSDELDFSKFVEVSNNGTVYKTESSFYVPSKEITEEQIADDSFISDAWSRALFYSVRDFNNCFIGKIPVVEGANEIRLHTNKIDEYKSCFGAYQDVACGSWDNIQIYFVDKDEEFKPNKLEVIKKPKLDYIVGERFSLDEALIYRSAENGMMEEVDKNKIQISKPNDLLPTDKTIDIECDGQIQTFAINVATKIVSEVENTDAPIKYVEPTHDRNDKNEVVGEDSEEVHTRKAEVVSKTNSTTKYLENVSAYSKFTYNYKTTTLEGKFDIYAYVASNSVKSWTGYEEYFPKATSGFYSVNEIDLSSFVTLKNNDQTYNVRSDAIVPEKTITSDMSLISSEAESGGAWGTCTYYLMQDFVRVHLGTIDINKGENKIEIDIGRNETNGFSYTNSACGNWDKIEFIFMNEDTNTDVKDVLIKTSPRTSYAFGEKFSLDGGKFVALNEDGIETDIDNSEIEILTNGVLSEDTDVALRYKGLSLRFQLK